ncbi:MAG: glycosyltransferase family 2 protein [Lachnospiraceae bacterium]|nr:glycosyltransferase family 2 protein [Lachnospiraceae bacterium]
MLWDKKTRKISVIIPLYNGKKYLPDIMSMLLRNLEEGKGSFKIELILINDFPDEKISYDDIEHVSDLNVILLINQENKGIHYSRVRGLSHASGEYIHFFDQDDRISDHFFESQVQCLRKRDDVIVANGIAEYASYSKLLYRYWLMQWTVKFAWFYLKFDCRIISPGQCLIKKSSIPDVWKNNILKQNGADDYFLWLIMLNQRKKIGINREILYTHKYTSANTSANKERMRGSVEEVLTIIEPMLGSSRVRTVRQRIQGSNTNRITKKLVTIVENINRN